MVEVVGRIQEPENTNIIILLSVYGQCSDRV